MHALQGAQIRIARPSRRYADVVRFYERLGLPVLARWEGHAGYDGTVFGLPDASRQLEILRDGHTGPAPTSEDQLVLYLGSAERVEELASRLVAGGAEERLPANPYWSEHGARCFVDPDGYWLVLSPDAR